MRLMTRSLAFLFLFTGLAAYAQDLTIVSRETHDGGAPETTVSYISTDRVRMSHGAGQEVIVDYKSGAMTTLDSKKKTYFVTTRADMDALAAKMKEMMNSPEMKKMQEQMNKIPADQRQKMNAGMDDMFKVDVQDLGTTRTIAGYKCENWKMDLGEYSKSESCLTNELKFPPQAYEMYRGFSESMKSMTTSFGPSAKSAEKMQEQFKKMKGYPLANTMKMDIMGHKSVIVSEVTEVRRGPVPATAWQVPAGYTQIESPMLRAMQSHSRR